MNSLFEQKLLYVKIVIQLHSEQLFISNFEKKDYEWTK